MLDSGYKEVYYDEYCPSCKNKNVHESEEPCRECLNSPVNLYSHKPTLYKERENYKAHYGKTIRERKDQHGEKKV